MAEPLSIISFVTAASTKTSIHTTPQRAQPAVSGVPSDSWLRMRFARSARRLALASEQNGMLVLSLSNV